MYARRNSKSGIWQESYVLSVLDDKKEGYYLELGSGDPYVENNTSLLEEEFGWRGLGIDIDSSIVEKYKDSRKNDCIAADALTFDYKKYFEENNFPKQIDYLQIDIDGHDDGLCLLALTALPVNTYRFSVITIEHDVVGDPRRAAMRDAQRQILFSLGYVLTAQLVSEDWWVDPTCDEVDMAWVKMHIFYAHPNVSNPPPLTHEETIEQSGG